MSEAGDWDLRGRDIDQRYARFGRAAMSDAEIWALSMASMVLPDGHPGCGAYLTRVAGGVDYIDQLKVWGRIVAIGISGAGYKPTGRIRRRAYVEGFDWAWGRFAVADGLTLALYGQAPGIHERADSLKVGEQAYKRVRDFIGGTLVNCIEEYRWALGWALGHHRDRTLEGRWEGITNLKWGAPISTGTMGGETSNSGIYRTPPQTISDQRLEPDPETLYHGVGPGQCWRESEAAPAPVITFKPRPGTDRLASDG